MSPISLELKFSLSLSLSLCISHSVSLSLSLSPTPSLPQQTPSEEGPPASPPALPELRQRPAVRGEPGAGGPPAPAGPRVGGAGEAAVPAREAAAPGRRGVGSCGGGGRPPALGPAGGGGRGGVPGGARQPQRGGLERRTGGRKGTRGPPVPRLGAPHRLQAPRILPLLDRVMLPTKLFIFPLHCCRTGCVIHVHMKSHKMYRM